MCIKSVSDFDGFSYYVDTKNKLAPADAKYVHTVKGDIDRLRQMLCAAWHADTCGVRSSNHITTASEFATALSACGIKCDVVKVQNGKKKVFAGVLCPRQTEPSLERPS